MNPLIVRALQADQTGEDKDYMALELLTGIAEVVNILEIDEIMNFTQLLLGLLQELAEKPFTRQELAKLLRGQAKARDPLEYFRDLPEIS